MRDTPRRLGAIVYPGFEMLDLFGPLEMFSLLGETGLCIEIVAERSGPVAAALGDAGPLGPRVVAGHDFGDAPDLDLLLVPGGIGTREQLTNPVMLSFLRERSAAAELVSSVCTGSALLARAGVLDGRRATSNKQVFALAEQQSDRVAWVPAARWVEDGRFFTSSGVSAGMDMALAVIARLWGLQTAEQVARYAEYRWQRDADHDPFIGELNRMLGADARP
jgi:putative intracellular protease/amidase